MVPRRPGRNILLDRGVMIPHKIRIEDDEIPVILISRIKYMVHFEYHDKDEEFWLRLSLQDAIALGELILKKCECDNEVHD